MRSPNEVYFRLLPRNQRPRIEPRPNWPRSSSCARPRTPLAGQPGYRFAIEVEFLDGHRHRPIVRLHRAADALPRVARARRAGGTELIGRIANDRNAGIYGRRAICIRSIRCLIAQKWLNLFTPEVAERAGKITEGSPRLGRRGGLINRRMDPCFHERARNQWPRFFIYGTRGHSQASFGNFKHQVRM